MPRGDRQNAGRHRQRPPGSRQRPAETARTPPEAVWLSSLLRNVSTQMLTFEILIEQDFQLLRNVSAQVLTFEI